MDRWGSKSAPRFDYVSKGVGNTFGQQFGGTNKTRPRRWSKPASQPLGRRGSTASYGSAGAPRFSYGGGFVNRYAQYTNQRPGQTGTDSGGWAGGAIGQAGQTGTKADQANPFLQQASSKYGVPVNFLKAILIRESSGDWQRDGSRLWNGRPQSGPLMPYVGIFKDAWDSWGCEGDFHASVGNQQAQIDCLAKGMAGWYKKAKQASPSHDWINVAAMHFSGNFDPNNSFCDENGLCTSQYTSWFMRDWKKFDGAQGVGQGPIEGGGSKTSSGIATLWGGGDAKDRLPSWGAFNIPSTNGLYGYGRAYGMNGINHTGIDIPGKINEPVYTPVAGRVVCACRGSGEGGCPSFNDVMAQGCGRIEVETPEGHRVIFGHSGTATVKVGDMVTPGQQIGTFGGMNSMHIHLEYRIRDPQMQSGWRIVDPAAYLGGAAVSPHGGGAPAQAQQGWGSMASGNLARFAQRRQQRYSAMGRGYGSYGRY